MGPFSKNQQQPETSRQRKQTTEKTECDTEFVIVGLSRERYKTCQLNNLLKR